MNIAVFLVHHTYLTVGDDQSPDNKKNYLDKYKDIK